MGKRYSREEIIELYHSTDLNRLSGLATSIREEKNNKTVWYNRNFHLEPSNVCTHRCKFCSYRRESDLDEGSWTMDKEEIYQYCKEKFKEGMTEVHLVGSVHPQKELGWYLEIIETVRRSLPESVTIKAFSAVEIDDMARRSLKSAEEVLIMLKERGVSALPGGGAEIFDPAVRMQICPDKADGERWLDIHRTAHKLKLRTNATMLFGHIESREQRVDHLLKLRELQDETNGFDAFIPLLFKSSNNPMSYLGEATLPEILKTFAISRIALDNIDHIKSYWPMLGKDICRLTLLYGADDIDGTINDSTKIYSMAGSDEQNPGMSAEDLEALAAECGYRAEERDSFYNRVRKN